jgi:hypothetical protein
MAEEKNTKPTQKKSTTTKVATAKKPAAKKAATTSKATAKKPATKKATTTKKATVKTADADQAAVKAVSSTSEKKSSTKKVDAAPEKLVALTEANSQIEVKESGSEKETSTETKAPQSSSKMVTWLSIAVGVIIVIAASVIIYTQVAVSPVVKYLSSSDSQVKLTINFMGQKISQKAGNVEKMSVEQAKKVYNEKKNELKISEKAGTMKNIKVSDNGNKLTADLTVEGVKAQVQLTHVK